MSSSHHKSFFRKRQIHLLIQFCRLSTSLLTPQRNFLLRDSYLIILFALSLGVWVGGSMAHRIAPLVSFILLCLRGKMRKLPTHAQQQQQHIHVNGKSFLCADHFNELFYVLKFSSLLRFSFSSFLFHPSYIYGRREIVLLQMAFYVIFFIHDYSLVSCIK